MTKSNLLFWFLRSSLLTSYKSLTKKLRGSEEINQQPLVLLVAGITWQISEKWDLKTLLMAEVKFSVGQDKLLFNK